MPEIKPINIDAIFEANAGHKMVKKAYVSPGSDKKSKVIDENAILNSWNENEHSQS